MSIVRPYGDTTGDGMVQLSFTLPIPHDKRAEGAAIQLANKMGMDPALLVHAKPMGDGFTFFVVYGKVVHLVDTEKVQVVERDFPLLSPKEANAAIKRSLRRRLVVVGGCIGTDAHTVGIDAILNMKGYAGDYGLERYPGFEAFNLGSQVPNEELIKKSLARNADAILVSQVVTQRDVHKDNSRQFIDAAKAAGIHGKTLLLLGGPRVDHKLALELGFDAGFGPGTKPSDVANYVVHAVLKKMGMEPKDLHYQGEPG